MAKPTKLTRPAIPKAKLRAGLPRKFGKLAKPKAMMSMTKLLQR